MHAIKEERRMESQIIHPFKKSTSAKYGFPSKLTGFFKLVNCDVSVRI